MFKTLKLGRWAIEVASEFPTARVIGMDLAPIQPTLIPINCEFIVGDFTEDLYEFDDGSTDLVHSRYFCMLDLLTVDSSMLASGNISGLPTSKKCFVF